MGITIKERRKGIKLLCFTEKWGICRSSYSAMSNRGENTIKTQGGDGFETIRMIEEDGLVDERGYNMLITMG